MTKLKIEGAGEYEFQDIEPFLGDLRLLKPAFGFGWGTVVRHVSQLKLNGSNLLDLLDVDGFPDALAAWVWMLRMRAGDRDLTAEDAKMLPIDAVSFVSADGDRRRAEVEAAANDVDASPTSAPTDSDRGDAEAPPAEQPTPASTKTSKPRSSRGSSGSATGGRGSPRKRSGS